MRSEKLSKWNMASRIIGSLANEPNRWAFSSYNTLGRDDGLHLFPSGRIFLPKAKDGTSPSLGTLNEMRILAAMRRWKKGRVTSPNELLMAKLLKPGPERSAEG